MLVEVQKGFASFLEMLRCCCHLRIVLDSHLDLCENAQNAEELIGMLGKMMKVPNYRANWIEFSRI